MLEHLYRMLSGITPEWATVIVAALPVSELRGSIPLAVLKFHFSWQKAFILSVIGNMIPVIPWLLFLNYAQKHLMKYKPLRIFFEWLFNRTRKKSDLIEKYETIGIMLFVAVPLPMTGAWSGCIAAFIFGTKLRHSLLAIFGGVLIAGAIVTALTMLGWIGGIIAGIALTALAIGTIIEMFKLEK